VIVRISSAVVPEHKATCYLEHVQAGEILSYEAAPGLISVSLLQRSLVAYVESMIISLWRSEDRYEGIRGEASLGGSCQERIWRYSVWRRVFTKLWRVVKAKCRVRMFPEQQCPSETHSCFVRIKHSHTFEGVRIIE
jgi:hypothetical protein